ncbi:hypothetical protein RDWZM_005426 [Blomia tropicalis]|uniref:DNA mismatch repair protein MutS core domain-containing protein n=1 Tax=Blomia tropicalis TaxID=40697 RepID=A0A9Q0M688_BLOTA|nr:hypothetical protein RDWZM_005426 [Blomia tropicalis]
MATEEVAANINISNENGFIAFFRSMPKCDDEVVRLFNRGDFHSIHGDQAVMVANNFLNTSQALRSIGPEGNKLYSVAISQSRFDSFIRFLLVDNNYRLEIYKKPSGKNQSEYNWFLDLKASPGCLGQLEELLYNVNVSSALNQNIAAINLDSDSKVHFALISVTDCTIYVGSFDDNSSYTLLESLLVRLNPKECLIPHNMNMDRIKMMLRKNNILFSKYDDSSSINSSDESESMISKLLKNEYKMTLSTILQESRNILVPIQALVNYLDLMKDRFCYSNYHLKLIESETFVRLDLSSISNLHLFPKNRSQKEIHSLFQVLNHCKTISGQKLLDSFIRQPLTDLAAIEQRLDNVEFFRNNLIITSAFYEHFLAKIPDITKVYKKLTNGRCKLKDLYQVYCVVEELPMMINTFEEKSIPSSIRETIFDIIKEVHEKLEPFKRLALKWIDFSRYNESKELWINSNIDDDLKKFKSKIDKLYDASKKELEFVRQDLYRSFDVDKEKVKLEEDKFGFYFRITKKCSNAVFQSKKYKEIRSTTKDSKFFSKNLNDINEEFIEYIGKYNELQQVYIEKFVEQARQYMDQF